MNDMIIVNNFPTPEFSHTVTMIYPRELVNEEIFQHNLSHIYADLKELIEETNLLERHQDILNVLKFDSQKKKQLEIIRANEKRIAEIEDRMIDEILPYQWVIFENFDDYLYECEMYIKADYLMILRNILGGGWYEHR